MLPLRSPEPGAAGAGRPDPRHARPHRPQRPPAHPDRGRHGGRHASSGHQGQVETGPEGDAFFIYSILENSRSKRGSITLQKSGVLHGKIE